MNSTATLTIRAVTSLEEFKGLAQEWEQLLRGMPKHSIFVTWEWQYLWAKHYLGTGRLLILLFLDSQERLVGIAPLYLRTTKVQGVFLMRELRLLGSEAVCSASLDIIASERDKRAVCQSLYRYLFNEARREWDVLTLSDVSAESSTLDHWNDFFNQAGKVGEIVGTTCCPVIRLPGDVAAYRTGLTRTRRYTLQRKRKYLEAGGNAECAHVTGPSEVGDALEIVMTLHRCRWSGGSTGGAFASEASKRFHREAAQVLSERCRVSFDFLLLNNRPIAGIYGFDYEGVYSFYVSGFEPEILPKASPGLLLLSHRIEQAIRDGAHTVDLLHGAEPYKLEWATNLHRLVTVRYYNRHVAAVGLKLLESAKQVAKILVR